MSAETHPDGLLFGPTKNGKRYLATFAHRGGNPKKSRWADDVAPPTEFAIFESADDNGQSDTEGHYWGVWGSDGAVLGARGERLAKFPRNGVPAIPWHGYPVAPASGRSSEIPPDTLIEAMIESGALSRTLGRKLQRRKA